MGVACFFGLVKGTLFTRLNDQTTGKMILIMQRLHQEDLAGHLLEQGGWTELKLSAMAEEDCEIPIGQTA